MLASLAAACPCIQGANAVAAPHCWTSGRISCTAHRARGTNQPVDAEMIANIQKSRDAWKTNARGVGAFEAGASMPFVKEGTVGAPDRSAPAHKFRDAYSTAWRLNGSLHRSAPRPSARRGRRANGR